MPKLRLGELNSISGRTHATTNAAIKLVQTPDTYWRRLLQRWLGGLDFENDI
jgi:hypothetical protein